MLASVSLSLYWQVTFHTVSRLNFSDYIRIPQTRFCLRGLCLKVMDPVWVSSACLWSDSKPTEMDLCRQSRTTGSSFWTLGHFWVLLILGCEGRLPCEVGDIQALTTDCDRTGGLCTPSSAHCSLYYSPFIHISDVLLSWWVHLALASEMGQPYFYVTLTWKDTVMLGLFVLHLGS